MGFIKRVKKFIEIYAATEERMPKDELIIYSKANDFSNLRLRTHASPSRDRCPSTGDTASTCSDLSDQGHSRMKSKAFCVPMCDECDISRVFSLEDEEKPMLRKEDTLSNSFLSGENNDKSDLASRSRIRRKKYDNWKKNIFPRKTKLVIT